MRMAELEGREVWGVGWVMGLWTVNRARDVVWSVWWCCGVCGFGWVCDVVLRLDCLVLMLIAMRLTGTEWFDETYPGWWETGRG